MIWVADGLRLCHDYGHFASYAAAIVASTLTLRTVCAGPLYTFTEKNQTLVTKVYCESAAEAANPKFSISQKDGKINRRLQQAMIRKLFTEKCQKYGCHPFKSSIFAMFQLPIWMTITFGLRNACGLQVTPFVYWPPTIPEFVTEGLVSPTTSLALIAATTFVTACNVEIGHLRRIYGQSMSIAIKEDPKALERGSVTASVPSYLPWQLKFAHGAGICGTCVALVASFFAPSLAPNPTQKLTVLTLIFPLQALVIYWCTSGSHQLILHILHLNNRVRRFLGIPTSPIDAKHPYQALWSIAKSHYRILRWMTTTTSR
nr:transportin 3 [Hymenolepis microstoma]